MGMMRPAGWAILLEFQLFGHGSFVLGFGVVRTPTTSTGHFD
jgi:hypothetical protein